MSADDWHEEEIESLRSKLEFARGVSARQRSQAKEANALLNYVERMLLDGQVGHARAALAARRRQRDANRVRATAGRSGGGPS